MTDVLVIGAGMAGSTAARELAKAGLSVEIVEARDRLGGRTFSVRGFCDHPVEGGAEFIHGEEADHWDFARSAGTTTRAIPQMKDMQFNIGYGTKSLPATLMHPGIWASFKILSVIKRHKGADLSAREFIEKHGFMGRARIMAELTLLSHLPGGIDEVGIAGLLEDNVLKLETGTNYRVNEGYDTVTMHIGEGLDTRFGFVIQQIRYSDDGVSVTAESGETIEGRAAISTLPLGVLQSGDIEFVPGLPPSKLEAFKQIKMGPVVKILLKFREPFWNPKVSTLVSSEGPVTLYWNVFYGMTGERPSVLTAYTTGPRAAAISAMSEEEGVAACLADLKNLYPKSDPASLFLESQKIDWPQDRFARGGYTFILPGGTGARAKLAAADTGALFWAGSATATTTIAASVQGAHVSGVHAARQAVEWLQKRG